MVAMSCKWLIHQVRCVLLLQNMLLLHPLIVLVVADVLLLQKSLLFLRLQQLDMILLLLLLTKLLLDRELRFWCFVCNGVEHAAHDSACRTFFNWSRSRIRTAAAFASVPCCG